MNEVNPVFWAKKSDKNGYYQYLSLKQHLEDTRGIMGKLWEFWLSPGDRTCIEASLSIKGTGKNIAEFLGAIHDLGKCTPEFQVKKGFTCSEDLDYVLMERLEEAGFSNLEDFKRMGRKENPHALAGEALLDDFGISKDIHSIVGGHHGRPLDRSVNYTDPFEKYPESYYQFEDEKNPICEKWKKDQKKILDWALETSGFSSIQDLPHIGKRGQVLLNGLLIMADWIASNESYFPLLALDEEFSDSESRLEEGWEKWYKGTNWQSDSIEDVEGYFLHRFHFKPKKAQSAFLEEILKAEDPGIFIFEAPMGMGKTEAALAGAEILAAKTGRKGLFFGLPTQATSNGMFPRIKDWLDSVGRDRDQWQSLRLIHGKASLNQDFASLPEAGQINMDSLDPGQSAVMTNRWFAGRKTSNLEDFVVATVDQCLLLALKQKHLALRHLGFSRKVVIIDEVHAYDAYMSVYLQEALKWLASYGVPVILLSATLPVKTRKKLLMSYAEGKTKEKMDYKEEDLQSEDYPLVTYVEGTKILKKSIENGGKEKTIQIEKVQDEDLLDLLEELMSQQGVVGMMVNTVKRAQELARQCIGLFGKDRVRLLHSSFIATDRIEKEKELLNLIGKNGDRPESMLIIGTQVIEQSLDIDFDVLITELAPMDLLIQRIGRLHRHNRYYPEAFKEAKVYVLGTREDLEFDRGSLAVYGGYFLARTQYYLPEVLEIPKDISPLVQRVYEEKEIDFPKDVSSKYQSMEKEMKRNLRDKESKAKVYCLEDPKLEYKPNQSLLGWLKTSAKLESEELAYAQVRDSDESIEVILLKEIDGGYGFVTGEEDLSYRVDEAETALALANQTIQIPRALCKVWNIDKTIGELEDRQGPFAYWQGNRWLRGSLGLLMDEDLQTELAGYRLTYDLKLGLSYEKL